MEVKKKMSMIAGALLGFYILLMLIEIATNWHIAATQFED